MSMRRKQIAPRGPGSRVAVAQLLADALERDRVVVGAIEVLARDRVCVPRDLAELFAVAPFGVASIRRPSLGRGARLAHVSRDDIEPRRAVARLRRAASNAAVIAHESPRRLPTLAPTATMAPFA